MSIDRAEELKEKLTDKYVVVDQSIPELRRFANWTGKVKTVNMSCRALVEFDGPVDIGWYDINPDYLTIVDGPRPKAAAKAHAPATPAAAKPAAAKPAAAGKSPLDAIRAQQAAKAGGTAAPAAGGAKPSPLDMIRKMGAAKKSEGETAPPVESAAAPAAAAEAAPAPAEVPAAKPALPTTGPDGKPLSKLDLIRMQGAKKS
ncbi:MAG: hypothetical protein JSS49_01330 [Planctomycetes bacterium]|nr:hypothetical protein [Planctomycetota bacterium]